MVWKLEKERERNVLLFFPFFPLPPLLLSLIFIFLDSFHSSYFTFCFSCFFFAFDSHLICFYMCQFLHIYIYIYSLLRFSLPSFLWTTLVSYFFPHHRCSSYILIVLKRLLSSTGYELPNLKLLVNYFSYIKKCFFLLVWRNILLFFIKIQRLPWCF